MDFTATPAAAAATDSSAAPLAPDAAYRALQTRDARFDGRLFVGVTSTGIYCRPVCRVRIPKRENCRFFANASSAEQQGFRPCLRCRPELAPGLSHADSSQVLAHAGARLIEHAVAAGEALALPEVARKLGVTDRHFRRVFQAAHGVTPMDWLSTQRLLLAKRLLTDTLLPVTEVAGASGFASLRRFNAAFAEHYRLSPGALRREAAEPRGDEPAVIRLPWRPPYDAAAMLAFLSARPLAGVEAVEGETWRRTLALQHRGQRYQGWLALRFDLERGEARAAVAPSLAPCLGALAARLRHLLDGDADPEAIAAALHGMAAPERPGLRLPGCIDGFETTVRIILGQHITVAAACTITGRLVARFGTPIATPFAALTHLFPTAQALAEASADDIGTLGIVRTRVGALQALARAVVEGRLQLHPAAPLEATLAALHALPGVGDWTVELVKLRVLAWPDAFPASDVGVTRALGGVSPAEARRLAEAWRPWRSYAVMRLWQAPVPPKIKETTT
ncbi:MAG TPA: Ada metal-binding domain-containing protein [Ideonella sp.]|nr:Ada metal-binding domain-containing protein [Ideonella sp.]